MKNIDLRVVLGAIFVAVLIAVLLMSSPGRSQTLTQDSQSAAQAIAIAGGAGTGGAAGRTQRVVTVPGVIPPSFYGANPCSNSASGGGAGMGFGISIGGQWTEQECRDQEWFRFLHMAGQGDVATAYVCARYERLRQAFRDAGRPCPQDRGAYAQAPQAPQAATLAPPPSPVQPARVRPDWCETASPSERRARAECR